MLTNYVSNANGAGGKESEKQRALWQRRLKLLNRMKVGFDQTRKQPESNGVWGSRGLANNDERRRRREKVAEVEEDVELKMEVEVKCGQRNERQFFIWKNDSAGMLG